LALPRIGRALAVCPKPPLFIGKIFAVRLKKKKKPPLFANFASAFENKKSASANNGKCAPASRAIC